MIWRSRISQKRRKKAGGVWSEGRHVEFKTGGGVVKTAHITTTEDGASARLRSKYPQKQMPNTTRPLPGLFVGSSSGALLRVPTPARPYASPVIETAVIDCSPRESDAKSRPTPPQLGLFRSTISCSLSLFLYFIPRAFLPSQKVVFQHYRTKSPSCFVLYILLAIF